jgi:hypothetical protein
MGLHNTAHYLKTKGRGDDTELVHMTKDEVHALKGLAAKHGGQLTINPETGLPEAGFLSNILPTVAGIAVGIATENPMLGAAVAGMGSYATTGSISRGLMAGLSAYGGAGLGASLAEAGAEAGTEAAVNAGNEAIKESANQMVTSNLSAALPEGATVSAETGAQIGNMKDAAQAMKDGLITPEQYSQLASQYSAGYAPVMNAANTMGSGLQAITASPSALGKFASSNISNIGMTAAPMFAGELTKRPTLPGASTEQKSNPFGLKTLSPDFKGSFPAQPTPAYVARYPNYVQTPYNPYAPVGTPTTEVRAASGGLMDAPPTPGLMDGGNTANVDFMGGDMYPTSQQHRSYYATPTQMPTSAQSVVASYEPKTNPLTGEMTANMREGGIASYSGKYGSMVAATDMLQNLGMPGKADYLPKGDPGIYQDTDPNTRNLDAYSASLFRLQQKAKAAGMKPSAIANLKPVMQLGDIEADAGGGIVGMAGGGETYSLGGYAAGGNPRLLKGPGDGMSDSIPANIGGKQPARLADGEFVVPADVVSHLGNGSTDAGAKKLYGMMDKIRRARTGKKKQAPEVKADKYLPR